jgi:hypothetical protein
MLPVRPVQLIGVLAGGGAAGCSTRENAPAGPVPEIVADPQRERRMPMPCCRCFAIGASRAASPRGSLVRGECSPAPVPEMSPIFQRKRARCRRPAAGCAAPAAAGSGGGVLVRGGAAGCSDARRMGAKLERPKVNRAMLDFAKSDVFDAADSVIRADGACRLNPELARRWRQGRRHRKLETLRSERLFLFSSGGTGGDATKIGLTLDADWDYRVCRRDGASQPRTGFQRR